MSDIASSLEGRPSGCAPCPLQGGGRCPEKKPFVPAASPSTAPRASGTGPAPRGPAAAQRFPHGREVSARWTKLSGQPAAEKEKAKHKLSCLPPAPESKDRLGAGMCMAHKVHSKHPEAWEGRRVKRHEKCEKRAPLQKQHPLPGRKCLLPFTHFILKMGNRGKKINNSSIFSITQT